MRRTCQALGIGTDILAELAIQSFFLLFSINYLPHELCFGSEGLWTSLKLDLKSYFILRCLRFANDQVKGGKKLAAKQVAYEVVVCQSPHTVFQEVSLKKFALGQNERIESQILFPFFVAITYC